MSQIMGSNLFIRDKLLYKIHRRHLAFVHSEMDMAISARFVTESVYKKPLNTQRQGHTEACFKIH